MWTARDHTADVLLEVEAATWPALLEEAARAYGGFVGGDPPRPAVRRVRKLAAEGADAVETWVRWWRGLHRLWTVEGALPVEAGVREGATATAVLGVARCVAAEHVDASRCTDVKAVTWHGAEVDGDDGAERWRGRIVLDV